jgi:predicted transcriptional regulator
MANRSLTEITIRILEVVNGYGDNERVSLTNIMTKLFLSHEQTKEYLMLLIEDDLLSYDSTMRHLRLLKKVLPFFNPTTR